MQVIGTMDVSDTPVTSPQALPADGQQQQQQAQIVQANDESNGSQQQQQQQQQQQRQQQPESGSSDSQVAAPPGKPRLRRIIRIGIAAIRTVLVLELISLTAGPYIAQRLRMQNEDDEEEDSGSDLDPADVLMDYLTGKTELVGLQLLSNKQLRQAVDNLITEDFQELGVTDRGAELRDIVEDIIATREGKAPPSITSSSSNTRRDERVGLGKLGPLKFRNTRDTRPPPSNISTKRGDETSPNTQQEAGSAGNAASTDQQQ